MVRFTDKRDGKRRLKTAWRVFRRRFCCSEGFDFFQQFPQSLPPVAFGVFDFGVKLGGGTVVFGQEEMRVVAETVGSCGFCLPLAAPDAFGDDRLRVVFVADEDKDAGIITAFVGFVGEVV